MDAAPLPRRAGFWRRFFAVFLNLGIIAIMLQLALTLLFQLSDGAFRAIIFTTGMSCKESAVDLKSLQPAPMIDPDIVMDCTDTFFGLPSNRSLLISKATKSAANGVEVTRGVSQSYPLGTTGKLRDTMALDWLVQIVWFGWPVYLVARRGQHFGDRLMSIRVMRTDDPERRPIGFAKAALREFLVVFVFPALPMLPALGYIAFWSTREFSRVDIAAPHFPSQGIWTLLVLGFVASLVIGLWLVLDIVRRRDPIYDRWAGTAVVYAGKLADHGSSSVSQ